MNEATTIKGPGGWPDDAPARSELFSLNPEGHSGDNLEDLTSYFRRLSEDHCLLPWSLAFHSIAPLIAPGKPVRREKVACSCYGLAITGVTALADSWAKALNEATGRNDLQLHTLVPLKAVVPPYKMLAPVERFCPACYADDERAGRPKYNRLLWAIDCVTACPLHSVRLQAVKNVKCDNENSFRLQRHGKRVHENGYWLPGVSRGDGRSLASDAGEPAREEDVQFARLVADFIDDLHHHPQEFHNGGAPATFLRYALDVIFGGNLTHFAQHLGVSKGSLHDWTWGTVRPSLPRVALIAYCCGCAVSDVILGNKVMLLKRSASVCSAPLFERTRKGARRPRNELQHEFEQLVESGRARSAREAADLLDVSGKFLRSLSPTLYRRAADAGQELFQRQARERQDLKFDEFKKSFDAIVARHENPARRRVQRDVFERTGMTFRYGQYRRFVEQARQLAEDGARGALAGAECAGGGERRGKNRPALD